VAQEGEWFHRGSATNRTCLSNSAREYTNAGVEEARRKVGSREIQSGGSSHTGKGHDEDNCPRRVYTPPVNDLTHPELLDHVIEPPYATDDRTKPTRREVQVQIAAGQTA